MTRLQRLGFVALLGLGAGCGSSEPGPPPPPPPPEGGDLIVSYFQGGAAPGAILLTISGGPVQSVTARSGQNLQVTFSTPVPGSTKVVVAGTLATGDILTVRVPDVSLASNYSVRVDQVADNVTFSLIDTSLHTLTIHR